MKRAAYWLVTFLIVLSPVAAFEASLRWMGLGTPILYRSVGAYYEPVPNQHVQRRHGAWVTIDGAGLRGTRAWTRPADRHILFLGDSVTWGGTGIDDRDTFAEVACRALEARTGATAVCGNAGVDAYGIDNMVARLDAGVANRANTIVVTLIAGDAIRGLTDFKGLPFFSRAPHGPFRATWEFSAIQIFEMAEWLLKSPHWQDMGDAALADASLGRLFDRLRRLQDQGCRILLVYSPYENDVPEQAFSTHVRTMLAGSGLPFLDMTGPVLSAAGARLYLDGTHLSNAGHALYGEAIAERLAAR